MSDKAAQAEFIKKAQALAHHSQPDSGIGEAARGPLHPISNEGAPITSTVALKNPPRAQ
jgi:hypothetical protein